MRVFNPTLREHGFTSPHTVIEMVNDDMPFLVDSISLALDRAGAHPAFSGASDLRGDARPVAGTLLSPARARRSVQGRQAASRRETAAGIVSTHRGGPDRRSRRAAVSRGADRAQHARRAGRVRRLASRCRTPRIRRLQDLSSLSARFDPSDLERGRCARSHGWKIATSLFWATVNIGCRGRKGASPAADRGDRPRAFCAAATSSRTSTNRTLPSDIRRQSRSRDLVLVTKANFDVDRAPIRIPRLCRRQAFRRQGPR